MDSEADPEEELFRFCETNLGWELEEDEIMLLRKLIIAAAKRHGFVERQPRRVDLLGREALNNRLEHFNCPYQLAKNTWTIIKRGGINNEC